MRQRIGRARGTNNKGGVGEELRLGVFQINDIEHTNDCQQAAKLAKRF